MVAPEVLFIGAPIKKEETVEELIHEDTKTVEEDSNYDDSIDDNISKPPPKTLLQFDIKNSNVEKDTLLAEKTSNVRWPF